VTVYDMILERFPPDESHLRPAIEGKRRLVERADVVFVISEHTRADLVELLGVDPAKTVLTYPASAMVGVAPAPLPADLVERPFLLYVGPRTRYKNFGVLQEAFRRSDRLRRELRVLCVGGGPDFQAPERELLREQGLAESFTHVGADDRRLKALYERAVALVSTSRYEGFGIPPLEAMESGCPVICCPVSSLPEVVGDAALFFDPDQPDELAARIEELLDSRSLREDLIAGGRARAACFS
jgi:glycosyltransferase involved in cell wall biosynthesis